MGIHTLTVEVQGNWTHLKPQISTKMITFAIGGCQGSLFAAAC